MSVVFYIWTALTLLVALSLLAYLLLPKQSPEVFQRLVRITRSVEEKTLQKTKVQRLAVAGSKFAAWLHSHLGLKTNPGLEERFVRAGMQGSTPGDFYQASRILGPLVLLAFASLLPFARLFWMFSLPALAYLAPDLVLSQLIRRRRACIRVSVPDVIDLLVICVDAGLGLDQAMLRVGQELSTSHPQTNQEILHINRQQRAGQPRLEAWQGMADRVQIPEIQSLVNMLLQTEKFGTPISKALATFAANVRMQRRQAAEEMAAKSTIKIIFPLVFFIFPPIFIVLLGPAALSIVHLLGNNPR